MSVVCKSCNHKNLDGQKFCSQCGQQLSCPECGFTNSAEAQFCGGCGIALDDSAVGHNRSSDLIAESLLGFCLDEIMQDVEVETQDSENLNLGSPKHLDQSALDELFDV